MIPKAKFGRPSKYAAMLRPVIEGKKPFLPFKIRSHADTCAMYYRNHYHTGTAAVRKHSDNEYRVYVEVNS